MTTEKIETEKQTPEVQENSTANPAADIPQNDPPVKRGRGRPSNAEKKLIAEGVPNASASQAAPKPTRQKKASKSADEIAALGKQLAGIHQMAAMLTGMPELAIHEQEGVMLAGGILGVAEQYDLSIDGKTGAALQLLAAAAMIYGPRAMAINARMKQAKSKQATDVAFREAAQQTPGFDNGQFPAN